MDEKLAKQIETARKIRAAGGACKDIRCWVHDCPRTAEDGVCRDVFDAPNKSELIKKYMDTWLKANDPDYTQYGEVSKSEKPLTERERFRRKTAAWCMASLMGTRDQVGTWRACGCEKEAAEISVKAADALLAELGRTLEEGK